MRTRLGAVERGLLGLIVPAWLVCFALAGLELARGGPARAGFWVEADGAGGPPRIRAFERDAAAVSARGDAGLERGDRLLRAGDADLRGLGPLSVWAKMLAEADSDRHVALTVDGAGGTRRVDWAITRGLPLPWRELFVAFGFFATGVFVLWRRSGLAEARLLFGACTGVSFGNLIWHGGPELQTFAWYGVQTTAISLAGPFLVAFAFRLGAEEQVPGWARALPLVLLPVGLFHRSLINGTPFAPDTGARLLGASAIVLVGASAWGIVRNHRRSRPAGRRKLQWAILGWIVALAPVAATALLTAYEPLFLRWMFVSTISFVALPVCLVVAIVRERLFEIDRLISAAATASLLLFAGLAGLLALVSSLGPPLAAQLGVGEGGVRIGLAVLLAALILPANRWLRPRVEPWFFPERRAFEEGFDALLAEIEALGSGTGAERAPQLLAEKAAALLRAGRRAVLVPEGSERLVRIDPPGVDADAGPEPALADVADRIAPSILDEGRGVALPIRVDGALAACVVLADKRSGNSFSSSEVGLLAAAAEKTSFAMQAHRDAERLALGRAREAEHRAGRERAEDLVQARSRFLATASHDLRQPLHALGLQVDALASRELDDDVRELVDGIRRSSESLGGLFGALLDVSRLDAEAVTPEIVALDVAVLLSRVAEVHAPEAAARGLALAVDAPPAGIRSDPVLLGRIVGNLVSNAVRYTESGRVTLRCRDVRGRVAIEVSDTGPGIPEADRRRIFGEFVRLGGAGASEGLGLGLAIVERLVALLGHELELESSSAGSTFRVLAPRADPPPSPTHATVASFEGRSAWVVDDDGGTRAGMARLLESWGMEVRTAASVDAVDALVGAGSAPDVLVSDLDLGPGETGLDLVARVRERLGESIPALVVSGDTTRAAVERVREAGLVLLAKPVPPVRLRAALVRLLRSGDSPA